MNLLLLNDGQDVDQFRVAAIIDSLYRKQALKPLLIVGIHAADRMAEYGVAELPDYNNNGGKASKYAAFIENELYPYARKKAGVRKFKSVVIAGCSLGGLSAMDFAWDHADKIDKVGIFSGSFWWRDIDAADPSYSDEKNRIMLNKIRSSRKRPKLQYWFFAGAKEETADRDQDGVIDVIDDTRDLIQVIQDKKLAGSSDIQYVEDPEGTHDYQTWSRHLAEFLLWAFGKP